MTMTELQHAMANEYALTTTRTYNFNYYMNPSYNSVLSF